MRTLTHQDFERARTYLKTTARPLERTRFEYEFEQASRAPALAALEAFRNDDGGFGRGLEPDLWLPSSSVVCTVEALNMLHELDTPPNHAFVTAAVDWLVRAFDPGIAAWRQITADAEAHPHAPWWNWDLHADGTQWPVGVLPRAEVLSHLWRNAERVPRDLLDDQTDRLVSDFTARDTLDPDSVARCEAFVRSADAPADARTAVAGHMRDPGASDRQPRAGRLAGLRAQAAEARADARVRSRNAFGAGGRAQSRLGNRAAVGRWVVGAELDLAGLLSRRMDRGRTLVARRCHVEDATFASRLRPPRLAPALRPRRRIYDPVAKPLSISSLITTSPVPATMRPSSLPPRNTSSVERRGMLREVATSWAL